MSNWKQPIPVNIKYNHDIDTLSRLIFYEILVSCRNADGIERIFHGNKVIYRDMKRGQCILKVGEFARDLKLPRKRIEKSLEILSKSYNEMQLEPMPFGTVITVSNYDDLVGMKLEKQLEVNSNSIRNEFELNASSKSVESVESVESEKSVYSEPSKELTQLETQNNSDSYSASSTVLNSSAAELPAAKRLENNIAPNIKVFIDQWRTLIGGFGQMGMKDVNDYVKRYSTNLLLSSGMEMADLFTVLYKGMKAISSNSFEKGRMDLKTFFAAKDISSWMTVNPSSSSKSTLASREERELKEEQEYKNKMKIWER